MRIVFRADSSLGLGTGHVMRCLTLAEQLARRGAEIEFISRDLEGNIGEVIRSAGFALRLLPRWQRELAFVDASLAARDAADSIVALGGEPVEWIVVDHYGLDCTWESRLRPVTKYLFSIDDLANRRHDCDVLLDQNLYEELRTRYDGLVPASCLRLLGPQFTLLRGEFRKDFKRQRTCDGRIRNVLVFFGGTDPTCETQKAIQAILLLAWGDVHYDIVVGISNPRWEEIRSVCSGVPGCSFHRQSSQMAKLMARADLAVGAGGTSIWERAALQLPTITVITAENQRAVTDAVARTGAIRSAGWHQDLTPVRLAEMIRDASTPDRLAAMSRASAGLMQGSAGETRIADWICSKRPPSEWMG